MAEQYIADSPNLALTAATARTTLLISTTSTSLARLVLFSVSCDAVATGLLKVEFVAGTITGGTSASVNVARMNTDGQLTAPANTVTSYSVEPTYTKLTNNSAVAIKTMIIPLPAGPFEIEYPLGKEFAAIVSSVLGVRLTSTTVSPNSYTSLAWEE